MSSEPRMRYIAEGSLYSKPTTLAFSFVLVNGLMWQAEIDNIIIGIML